MIIKLAEEKEFQYLGSGNKNTKFLLLVIWESKKRVKLLINLLDFQEFNWIRVFSNRSPPYWFYEKILSNELSFYWNLNQTAVDVKDIYWP